jgi:hypothetical protein
MTEDNPDGYFKVKRDKKVNKKIRHEKKQNLRNIQTIEDAEEWEEDDVDLDK